MNGPFAQGPQVRQSGEVPTGRRGQPWPKPGADANRTDCAPDEPAGATPPPDEHDLPPEEGAADSTADRPALPPDGDLPPGFDPEINSRYEEIKRGNTYITELQQMTTAQLLKTAKDEGLA